MNIQRVQYLDIVAYLCAISVSSQLVISIDMMERITLIILSRKVKIVQNTVIESAWLVIKLVNIVFR